MSVAAAASTDSESSGTAPSDAAPVPTGRSAASTALLIGGFGVAGVSVVLGSITGALSLSKTSSIKASSACDGSVCNPSEDADLNSAKTMATVSTVSFVVAGVGAVVGIVGLFTGGSSAPAPKPDQGARLRVEPMVGLGSLGLRGQF